MKNTTTTTTAEIITAAYTEPERRAGRAITNNANNTYSPILEQLRQAYTQDHTARLAPHFAELAAEERAAAADLYAQADRLTAYADRLTISREEAAKAAKAAKTIRTQANAHTKAAEDLDRLTEETFSDRADLTQAAALALLEEPTKTERAAAERTAAESGEEWTEEQIAAVALKRHATNASQAAIRAAAHPDANNRHTTKTLYRLTPDEVEQWTRKHGGTGGRYKEPQTRKRMRESDCFDTVEYKTYKSRPQDNGFYRVRHYVSIAPYTSLEWLTEEGTLDHYTKSRTQYADTQGDFERLEELAENANLTPRERQFVSAFISNTAISNGEKARRRYFTECDKNGTKPTEDAASNAAYRARIDFAFAAKTVELENTKSRSSFLKRMGERLEPFRNTAEPLTAAERQEQSRKEWERLQSNRRRGHADRPTAAPDLLKWCNPTLESLKDYRPTHTAAVVWIDRAAHLAALRRYNRIAAEMGIPHRATAATMGKDYRAAEIERRAAEQAAHAKRHAEQAAALAALKAAQKATQAAQAAEWSNRPTYPMTAAEWNATPAAARLALLDRIHADGKRLEIVKA